MLQQKGVDDILSFKDFKKKMSCPFVIYCDFETCEQNPAKSSTAVIKRLDVCSFGYKHICTDPRYKKGSVIYCRPDASRRFIECLLKEKEIKEISSHIIPLKMSEKIILPLLLQRVRKEEGKSYWKIPLCDDDATREK